MTIKSAASLRAAFTMAGDIRGLFGCELRGRSHRTARRRDVCVCLRVEECLSSSCGRHVVPHETHRCSVFSRHSPAASQYLMNHRHLRPDAAHVLPSEHRVPVHAPNGLTLTVGRYRTFKKVCFSQITLLRQPFEAKKTIPNDSTSNSAST